ncbi:hypothetical protein OG948_03035 [Embleya sp. NBC_00888]|uniref:hypothetical protein n=1 Tax=Embleya sp. NBC_00888 TaxID=2975960 RepID=UPI0038700AC8|nr:hypothetical protein OG948_03035 [Embleya sp. NBC_00888]
MRYVEVRPTNGSFGIRLHAVEDTGHERFLDLGEFPPFDPEADEFGRLLGTADDPLTALDVAEESTGAKRDRWVNGGIAQDEYGDFVRAGRPPDASPDGRPWPAPGVL